MKDYGGMEREMTRRWLSRCFISFCNDFFFDVFKDTKRAFLVLKKVDRWLSINSTRSRKAT